MRSQIALIDIFFEKVGNNQKRQVRMTHRFPQKTVVLHLFKVSQNQKCDAKVASVYSAKVRQLKKFACGCIFLLFCSSGLFRHRPMPWAASGSLLVLCQVVVTFLICNAIPVRTSLI